MTEKQSPPPPQPIPPAREARLAAALRANLRRRKTGAKPEPEEALALKPPER
jgi:hypothetical protein